MNLVTFEIAKKLKEKGFDYPCVGHYVNNQLYIAHYQNAFHSDKDESIDAPTTSQVLKWLREEKDIDLVINPVFFYDDDLGKMREYGCKVFAPSLNKPEHCGYHEEWEQASLAGIEYVLDNLIG